MILGKFQQPRKCREEKCNNSYAWYSSLPLCRLHRRKSICRPTTLTEFIKGTATHNETLNIVNHIIEDNPILEDIPYMKMKKVNIRSGLPSVFWRKTLK